MYGYIVVNQQELKFKDFDIYQSYYCGLCKAIRDRGGELSRIALSYDMTAAYMLLTDLYDPPTDTVPCKCILHPFESKRMERMNTIADYVADMSIALAAYKAADDWNDERRLGAGMTKGALARKCAEIAVRYPDKIANIKEALTELGSYEQAGSTDIDTVSGCFGRVTAEIMVYREDEWEKVLSKFGFFLGKFVYVMDAYDDLKSDVKKGRYNPLVSIKDEPDFDDRVYQILTMMIAETCREFERLPLVENAEILRNILYSGVWTRYHEVRDKRNKKAEEADQ